MSMKSLADGLNDATRLYNSGAIDYLHYQDLCDMHRYWAKMAEKK